MVSYYKVLGVGACAIYPTHIYHIASEDVVGGMRRGCGVLVICLYVQMLG